jgi:Co/Zn/Cd efflux system component
MEEAGAFVGHCTSPSSRLRRGFAAQPFADAPLASTAWALARAAAATHPLRAGGVAWLLSHGLLQLLLASSSGRTTTACAAILLAYAALNHACALALPLLASTHFARADAEADARASPQRARVLAGFATSIAVGGVLLTLVFEAVECLFDPSPPVRVSDVLQSALCVAAHYAAVALDPAAAKGARRRAGATTSDDALPAMRRAPRRALRVSCGAFASVLVSSALGVSRLDAACALALAGHALASIVWPVFGGAATVLLQASPRHLREGLADSLRAISALDGILEVKEARFWSLGATDCVAALHVRLRHEVDEEAVRARVRALLPTASRITVQVEADEWLM